ncbi:LexA family protein [Shewanella aestuarii]|uniref:S24 family peptidase n=1 Tax=Shewanella aestuarii TaxID=1028752 RepID=A0A6G9QPH4_9GAMM|nr:S24 family peptidase [Shewanella aestuarii]QIR16318.1 S24 family peptidase [Shewanella aestuarii]
MQNALSLDDLLIDNPSSTLIGMVDTDDLNSIGIYKDDLLIINRALKPRHNDVVVAEVDGQWVCSILDAHQQRLTTLKHDHEELMIIGVVSSSIRCHGKSPDLSYYEAGNQME